MEHINESYEVDSESLSKSNILIQSKFKASLTCQKVLYAALLKVQSSQYLSDESGGQITVKMPASELFRLLGIEKAGQIYSYLDPIANQMIHTPMGVTDPSTGKFNYWVLITNAKYDGGVFTVMFNSELKKYITELGENFTQLPRRLMMGWKSAYTYRLYELLKQSAYYPRAYAGPRKGIFKKNYDVYELKLLLGVVNSSLDSVQTILKNTNPPDYKKACETASEKMYNTWREFKRNVIDKAVNEINNTAENGSGDIRIKYTPLAAAHNKVYAIEFVIYDLRTYKPAANELEEVPVEVSKGKAKVTIPEDQKFIIQLKTMDILEKYGISPRDVISVCEAAGYDVDAIKKAADVLEIQKNVNNVTGFLISAIKNEYTLQSYEKAPGYEKRNDYDFDEIEKRLQEMQNKRLQDISEPF